MSFFTEGGAIGAQGISADGLAATAELVTQLPIPADRRVTTLYPDAVSRAFAYQGSYIPETNLAAGAGYWLKFNAGQPVSLTGFPVGSV